MQDDFMTDKSPSIDKAAVSQQTCGVDASTTNQRLHRATPLHFGTRPLAFTCIVPCLHPLPRLNLLRARPPQLKIEKQRWSYACAKQLIERLVYAEGAENGLKVTIVRPFNWIGLRMDFIPGIDGPSEGVPRVLACFSNVYSKVSGEQPPEKSTIDVSSKEFYDEGYDDTDKRIPDITIINKQLDFPLGPV
ncbi:UDP-D-apiose/UDP-D-xylose synthase-like [Vicia villosa]|uniref:UDP-D-apiose/UDP-D-xylose synthase-like n=1 Tax=Vicia villosa TaxID=3911 RepID=UPI00273AE0E2|nr:UDP-D-apiose/UDP-D-xylose synthase-like [Vicia villosa]